MRKKYATAVGVFCLFVLALPAKAQSSFSIASLRGDYGFTIDGAAGGTPVAGPGVLRADGAGLVTGSLTIRLTGRGSNLIPYTRADSVHPDGIAGLGSMFATKRKAVRTWC